MLIGKQPQRDIFTIFGNLVLEGDYAAPLGDRWATTTRPRGERFSVSKVHSILPRGR